MGLCRRSQKFSGTEALRIGIMLDHVETPLPTCYCTRLGQSYVELHGCRWGSQKFGDTGVPPLVVGHCWHPRNALSRMCYSAEFGCYSSSHMGIGRCLKKILCTLWPCPIGIGHGCPCRNMHRFFHIGLFKVARGHQNRHRSISYLCLPDSVTVTICGDACPLSCASAEAYKLAQCTRPQGWGS